MAASKITYADKIGINPKETHENQVWDDDMNEIKLKVNDNADLHDALEPEVDINTLDIVDLKARTANVVNSYPVLIPFDFPLNTKTSLESLHGSLTFPIGASGIILNSTTPITASGGLSRVLCVVSDGSDLVGGITITGTSVDRNTGVETASDTETISVNGLTIDTSTTDSNGNPVRGFSNGYISSKWWKGALIFSTTDLTLTDVTFAQLAYEQFNDSENITVNSFDAHYITSNTSAVMDCYMYSVEVSGNTVVIQMISDLHHLTGNVANVGYRRRKGNIAKALNGTTSGIYVDLWLKPSTLQYFSSFSLKIWATKQETTVVNFLPL